MVLACENLQEVFVIWLLLLLFSSLEDFHSFLFIILLLFFIHFCSSFCCCSSFIFVLHLLLLLYFIHCFSTSSLTLPWTIAEFLHPFYTFSPSQSDSQHFHFQPFQDFLSRFTASPTVLSGDFFTHRHFFNLRYFR